MWLHPRGRFLTYSRIISYSRLFRNIYDDLRHTYATLCGCSGARVSDIGTILDVMPRISGDRLRRVRDRRLLSQRELAERAGLSPTTILKLESGRVEEPHPRTIRKLADALEVDPAELVEGE